MASEVASLRWLLEREKGRTPWRVDGTPLKDIQRHLAFNIVKSIRRKLAKGSRVRCLVLGAGNDPRAVRELADEFKNEVAARRLELVATHVTRKADWPDYLRRNADGRIRFERATIPMLVRKGMKADVVFDHFGPIFHSGNHAAAIGAAEALLRKNGILVFHLHSSNLQDFNVRRALSVHGALSGGTFQEPRANPYGFRSVFPVFRVQGKGESKKQTSAAIGRPPEKSREKRSF